MVDIPCTVGKGVGVWGWGNDGGGEGGGKGGWGQALIEVLNKTGIITFSLVIGMHIMRRNWPKSRFLGGFPKFWQEIPDNDIIVSQKHHVLTPKTRR